MAKLDRQISAALLYVKIKHTAMNEVAFAYDEWMFIHKEVTQGRTCAAAESRTVLQRRI